MFAYFTGVDYQLKDEKVKEINAAQIELFENGEEEEGGITPELAESLGIPMPNDNQNRRSKKFLLKEDDYEKVIYDYAVRRGLVEEFFTNQDESTTLKLETGELIMVQETFTEVDKILAQE